jgi:hypothetical protein
MELAMQMSRLSAMADGVQRANKTNRDKLFMIFLGMVFVCNALEAYAIGPIPLPWIAQVFSLLLFLVMLSRGGISYPPGLRGLLFVVFALAAITLFNIATNSYQSLMPSLGTTSYSTYKKV